MTFKKIREQNYPDVKINVQIYQHEVTGAIHHHTQYDTTQNTFNVVFTTLPTSSNGVAHILEHSVLMGSRNFPMHGVFFAMAGRNFETFMNAMTALEGTQYPFSSIDKKGYFNLMKVYLDAVFFPNLEKEIFLQEGWRYAFKEPANSRSELEYSGVVFNEMKGAYADLGRVSYVEMLRNVFHDTQYENFSGGHPVDITNLSYEEFIDFHKKYYHPSNATFYTFGSLDPLEIQQKLEDWVLNEFDKSEVDNRINIKNRNISGQTYQSTHPADEGIIYFRGYELEEFKTIEDMYTAELLLTLLQSGKSDFKESFLQSELSVSADGLHLLPVAVPVLMFDFQMDSDKVQESKHLLNEYFQKMMETGFDTQELDNIFNSIELEVREGEASQENMGLATISRYIGAARYGLTQTEEINDIRILKNIRHKFEDKESFRALLKKYFIDNTKTFDFISHADHDFNKKLEERLSAKVKAVALTLSEEEKEAIVQQSATLEKIRQKEKDFSLLPQLTFKDIEIEYPQEENYEEIQIAGSKTYVFERNTRGVTYFKAHYPLTDFSEDDYHTTKLLLNVMENLPLKGMTVEETSLWKQSHIGELEVGLKIVTHDEKSYDSYLTIEGKALSEYSADLAEKILYFTRELSFDNTGVFVNTVSSAWREYATGYQDNAHKIAMTEAQASFQASNGLKKLLTNDFNNYYLKELMSNIENQVFQTQIIEKVKAMYERVFNFQPLYFICADKPSVNSIKNVLKNAVFVKKEALSQPLFEQKKTYEKKALDMNIPVNHMVYVLQVPPADQKEGGQFQVLSSYVRPYLITNIREKGGAYGAQANYQNNGLFTLFSFRDPNGLQTLHSFEKMGEFLINEKINEKELEMCKLNIIKNFNKPKEEIHLAMKQFEKILKTQGTNEALFIESVLNTTPEDLVNLARHYLVNGHASIVVATNEETSKNEFSAWDYEKIEI